MATVCIAEETQPERLHGHVMLRLSAMDSYLLFHAKPHICHSDVYSARALCDALSITTISLSCAA